MNSWITTNVWLIPAAPILAALLILAFGKAARREAAAFSVTGQLAALTMSIFAFVPTLHSNGFRSIQNFTWFTFGEQTLRIGFVLDPLAAAMLLMIGLVGLCIFIFSIGYMAEDKNFCRFFAYLSFFSGAMLGVVIANSLLLLFVFWELVGLASYLLIGFWIDRPSAAAAAKKAFITTRIGFSASCGSITAAAHYFFMMAGEVALKMLVCSRSAPARRLSRFSFFAARPASPVNFRSTSGCRTRWKVRLRSAL